MQELRFLGNVGRRSVRELDFKKKKGEPLSQVPPRPNSASQVSQSPAPKPLSPKHPCGALGLGFRVRV